jgi:hypothetical protein
MLKELLPPFKRYHVGLTHVGSSRNSLGVNEFSVIC